MSTSLSLSSSSSASPSLSLSHPSTEPNDFSPPPSPTAVDASASTVRSRLQLLLSTTSFLGPTTGRQRSHLDKSSLIQRGLEIQAQLLLLDEQLEELPSQSEDAEVRGQLDALYAESDALAEESDEVETLLYEKWRLKSGGRMLLLDEMRDAAAVGERLARGTRGRMKGEKPVAVDKADDEKKQAAADTEEVKEEAKDESKDAQQEESKANDVADDSLAADVSAHASEQPADDEVVDVTPAARTATPSPRRGRRGRGRLGAPLSKRKRQSKSDVAMLARLNAQADENEQRRQERAEVNKGSLLGKLYDYFDREVDVERVVPQQEPETDEQRAERRKRMADKRKAAARSYPYTLGTFTFPLFPLSEERKDDMEADSGQQPLNGEAESVRLDFDTEVPVMGEDGCVVRRNRKGVPMEEDDIVGFLPFPFHFTPFQSASTSPFTLPTSPFPLPFHPLLALHMLLKERVISLECSIDRQRRDDPSASGGEVDVAVFVHDKFLQRTRLRSHLLRQAMLSLFRSFPPPARDEDGEEDEDEEKAKEEDEKGEEAVAVVQGERKEDEAGGAPSDKASGGGMIDDAMQETQPTTDIFTLLQRRRADSSLSNKSTADTASSSASSPSSPSLSLSPVSIATTASLATSSLSSPAATSVAASGSREKRRIVPMLMQEETKEEAAAGWGKDEREQADDGMGEDGEQSAEDEEDGGEEEEEEGLELSDEYGEEEEDESEAEEEEEEDEFGLDELDLAEHMHCFVPLHLMSAPPASEEPQPEESTVALTEEEMKEEKQLEDEGVRIEESYELDPAVLEDDDSPLTALSTKASTASSPSSASSTPSHTPADPTRTSLHTLAWQKRDLDSLYDSIRPSPAYARHPNPLLLATTLLPFQQQALAWMVERETRPRSLPHPLFESVVLHGLRCWYNRVSGEMESVEVQEARDVRGGILAEMMGLGKTIEMIALVLERPYKPPVSIAALLPPTDAGEERKVEEVSVKVEEAKNAQDASGDVSMAPLLPRIDAAVDTISSPRSPPFQPTPSNNSSPMRSPPPPRIFRTPSFSSALSPTPIASSKLRAPPSPTLINPASGKPEVQGTLIITPMSIVYQWKAEIQKHAPSLKVLIYQPDMQIKLFPSLAQSAASAAMGIPPADTAPPSASTASPMSPGTPPSLSAAPSPSAPTPSATTPTLALSEYDIVLCNYSILASQVNYSQQPHYNLRYAKQYAVPLSPLLEVHWHRLVLDEAQRVQSPTANSARMCARVNASYRWAVTGTPIGLNGLNDMYGLVSFLGVGEYSSAAVWQHCMRIEEEEGMERLRELLRRIMWRHSKQMVKDQISLPPLYTHTHSLRFNEVEHEAYRRMEFEIRGRIAFQVVHGMLGERDDYVKRIDALRQMCDHPQVLAGGMFSAPGRTGGRGGADSSRRFDTMEVIGWRIMQRAKDEASEREREVCRTLNWTGFLLRKYGRDAEAEGYLKESWRIYDRGLEEAAEDDREKRRFEGEEKVRSEEVRARKGEEEDGGEFDSESNIVTANTQAKQWRYIELVASYHLKGIYQRRLDVTPDDSALEANVVQLQDKLERALDELLDLLTMQLTEARSYIDDMRVRILPLWTTRLEAEPQRVYDEWKAAASMEEFFSSPHYKTVLQLQKRYQRLERHVERICNLMERERHILLLEELIHARQSSPDTCRARQFVHQQLLNTYYAADVQAAVDRVLSRALAVQQRERKNVWQLMSKSTQAAEEVEELRTLDWSDDARKAQYEARWSLMREQMNAMLALVDLRKAVKKEWKLRELMGKTRRYLLRQCANPPANFGQQGIAIYEVEEGEEEKQSEAADDSADGEERKEGKAKKEKKGGKEEKEEQKEEQKQEEKVEEPLLTADELEEVLLTLKSRLAEYKVEAQQKQRHVKYLKNKLTMLSIPAASASPASSSAAAAATSSSSSSSSAPAPAAVGEACPICNGALVQPVITSCGHVYCLSCLQRWMKKRIGRRDGSDGRETRLGGWERGSCPTCRHELVRDDVVEMPQDEVRALAMDDDDDEGGLHEVEEKDQDDPYTVTTTSSYSAHSKVADEVKMPSLAQLAQLHFEGEGESGTKVDCIIRHLLYLTRHHPRTKSLVYSQFPRMLLLFSHALTRAGIAHLQLTGNDSKAAAILHTFSTSSSHPILLLSLRRDSSGLTLVSASHVFLFEPSLSRSVELQAVNRIHRIGQRSVCHVYRFVMRRSVEAKIDQQVHGGGDTVVRRSKRKREGEAGGAEGGWEVEEKEERMEDEEGGTGEMVEEDAVGDEKALSQQRRKELLNRSELFSYLGLDA